MAYFGRILHVKEHLLFAHPKPDGPMGFSGHKIGMEAGLSPDERPSLDQFVKRGPDTDLVHFRFRLEVKRQGVDPEFIEGNL